MLISALIALLLALLLALKTLSNLHKNNVANIKKNYLSFTPDRGMRAVSALQLDEIA